MVDTSFCGAGDYNQRAHGKKDTVCRLKPSHDKQIVSGQWATARTTDSGWEGGTNSLCFSESDIIQRLSRGFLFNLLAQYLDGGIFPVFTMVWKFVQIPKCCREIRAVRVSRGETLVFYFAESFGYPRPRDAHAAHISVPV
jgi:hypothetical protein